MLNCMIVKPMDQVNDILVDHWLWEASNKRSAPIFSSSRVNFNFHKRVRDKLTDGHAEYIRE